MSKVPEEWLLTEEEMNNIDWLADNPEFLAIKEQAEKIYNIVDKERKQAIEKAVKTAKRGFVEFLEEKAFIWEDKGYRGIGEAFRLAAKELK